MHVKRRSDILYVAKMGDPREAWRSALISSPDVLSHIRKKKIREGNSMLQEWLDSPIGAETQQGGEVTPPEDGGSELKRSRRKSVSWKSEVKVRILPPSGDAQESTKELNDVPLVVMIPSPSPEGL